MVPSSKRAAAVDRRKPATREEKDRRVLIHKMHLLCLLAHVELRNRWCNDPRVQETLGGMVTDKIQGLLNPRANLPQYSKSESLKRGLTEIGTLFRCKYLITERGLRRALWAEDPEETLGQYKLPDDTESTFEKSDFLDAAKTLRGSRDVGAQLFCALLRSAGVETRLVCSLQPLACAAGSPAMPKQRHGPTQTTTQAKQPSKMALYEAAVAKYETNTQIPDPGTVVASPRRRRLGHPNATAYHVPNMTPVPTPTPQVHTPVQGPKVVKGESMYPVYWVEVLDKAYQKWQPVDPLVTHKQFAPKALEPPAADTQNCLSYAVAFDTEGCVKDVTRRYARAYNSKTRRLRVDGVSGTGTGTGTGEKWWRRALRRYRRLYENDLDQIEETELAAEEAKEPMPKNVADFKDHPVYALERHLRRHEVLVPDAQTTGTIKASTKGSLERIYRRRDVRVARSRDKWYRLGRVVKVGEEPVKILPKIKRKKGRFDDDDDEQESEGDEERDPDRVGLFGDALLKGTPIYSIDQTDLYEAEPVVNGRIPKNKFGNIDIYVPSMAPRGGVHIIHERAAQAAYILGVDYAPALTGFKFSGRTGTAVLSGVVVAQENEEGVRETIQGLEDMDEELEQERRSRLALRMWSRLLKGLRIRERIWANNPDNPEEEEKQEGGFETDKGKGKEVDVDGHEDLDMQDAKSDVSEEYFMGEDEEGGGFLI
ncbi:Rad4-domain-containing protein, partial [Diplogelasinospora grovesii]